MSSVDLQNAKLTEDHAEEDLEATRALFALEEESERTGCQLPNDPTFMILNTYFVIGFLSFISRSCLKPQTASID